MITIDETIARFKKQQKRYMREHNGRECPHYKNAIDGLLELKTTRGFITDKDLAYELSCYANNCSPDYMEGI